MLQELFMTHCTSVLRYSYITYILLIIGLMQNEKTSVMTTLKPLGTHIWQICWGTYPPHQFSIDALNTSTPHLADLLADLPPCCQSNIDALNTITPDLADLLAELSPTQVQCIMGIYIMGCICQPFWILQEKVGIFFISE